MRPARLLLLLATAVPAACAYPCSQSEAQTAFGLYRAAAARAGCAQYATYGADGSVTINWSSCSDSCAPTMQQLAYQLPNCESSDGINRKARLDDALYNKCQLCSFDQQDQIVALWKNAAQNSACSPYATAGGTWFSWPCSATSCTAALRDMANKMPSCFIDGQNERARILNGISTCTGTTVSTRTPAPAATSSGASNPPPTTTSPPRTAPPTTEPPTFAPETTTESPASDSDSSSTTSPPVATPSPSSTFSMSSCYNFDIDGIVNLYLTAATSANCKKYSLVTANRIYISAPCSSPCVVTDFNNLAESLPDCYYSYDKENKKQQVTSELAKCKAVSGRRLLGSAADQNVTLVINSVNVIKNTNTPTSAPAKSAASHVAVTWIAVALAAAVSAI